MTTMELGPVEKYQSLVASNKFVFLVCSYPPPPQKITPLTSSPVFRGHWCPFCIAYLKTLQGLTKRIEAEGGVVLVATSEPKSWLPETRKLTGYSGEAIVDEEHVLATHLRTEGKVDVAISEHKGYAHGMAQPAILVVNTSGEVLEKWAIVPAFVSFPSFPLITLHGIELGLMVLCR